MLKITFLRFAPAFLTLGLFLMPLRAVAVGGAIDLPAPITTETEGRMPDTVVDPRCGCVLNLKGNPMHAQSDTIAQPPLPIEPPNTTPGKTGPGNGPHENQ